MKKTSLITLENYLDEVAPEAFGKVVRTWPPRRFAGDGWANSPQCKRHSEAETRCRQVLLDLFDEGEIEVSGRGRNNPLSRFAVLDLDRQREVLERWKYNPDRCPPGEVYLPDYGNMPVRVFRRDGQGVGIAETNHEELSENRTYKQEVIKASDKLKSEGDPGGHGFYKRIYDQLPHPRPAPDTVRKYTTDLKLG